MTPASECHLLADVDATFAEVDLDEHEAALGDALRDVDAQAKAASRPTMRPGKDCGR